MIMKKYILIPLFILVFSFLNLNYINSREEPESAYDFSFKDIDGKHFSLSQFKGKPLLIFNSASKCGFTSQYTGLQKIHENYKDKGLVVIGVPSDNFNQEPGSEKEIKEFCMGNFNITFNLTKKNDVLAIIPAREGSKGIKDKNIKLLNGHPLLAYSVIAGLNSKIVNRVICSTVSLIIAYIA